MVEHKINKGKSAAILSGFKYAKSEIILLMDADLTNLQEKHVTLLIKKFIEGRYDMVLGDRNKETVLTRILGISIALTGERVIKTHPYSS